MIIELTVTNSALYREDILKCLSDGFGETFIPDAMFTTLVGGCSGKIFLYLLDGVPVSMLTLLFEIKLIHNGSYVAHIEDVCTKVEHRNAGFSTELINHACEFAKKIGCYKVILDSKLDGFYEKLGFKAVERCYRKDL